MHFECHWQGKYFQARTSYIKRLICLVLNSLDLSWSAINLRICYIIYFQLSSQFLDNSSDRLDAMFGADSYARQH